MTDRAAVDRLAVIGIAICLVIFGGALLFDPIFSSSFGYQFNFGRYHSLVGLLLVVAGALILYKALRRRK